jgi:hypothetical protein
VSNNHKATNKHAITGKQHFSFANICVSVINKHKSYIPIPFGAIEKFFWQNENFPRGICGKFTDLQKRQAKNCWTEQRSNGICWIF